MDKRFTLTGFTFVRQADTPTHEVEVGKIKVEGETLICHLIRRKGLPEGANFLIACIFDAKEENVLWTFPKGSLEGIGLLTAVEDDFVIAFAASGKTGKIFDIVSLRAHLAHKPLDMKAKIELKRRAADTLGREAEFSAKESKVFRILGERQRKEEADALQQKHEARQKAREELITLVLSRGKVTVYTHDGQSRFGFPVTESEWPMLSNNTFVVLVESYDDKLKQPGTPIEAFRIVKAGGKNPSKGSSCPVTWEQPTKAVGFGTVGQASIVAPNPLYDIVAENDTGDMFEVVVYSTMDDIRRARAAGLNSGTYVAAADRTKEGIYEVFSVHSDSIDTIGKMKSL